MKIKIWIWNFGICMLLCAGMAQGQNDTLRPVRLLPYKITTFSTNLAGELFTVGAGNALKKFDSNGDSVGVFNDVRRYGKLTYVRAENPWRVLLFYQNYQTVVLLDKYLENTGKIALRDMGMNGVKAVSPSYDNNIWLFDRNEFKIKKIDENGKVLLTSVDFRQLFNEAPDPVWMKDADGLLYLYDPERGIYIFDYYTTFRNRLPFKNWKWLDTVKKGLIGFDDRNIYEYRPPLPDVTVAPLPTFLQNADQIDISIDKIYVLKNGWLSVFKR